LPGGGGGVPTPAKVKGGLPRESTLVVVSISSLILMLLVLLLKLGPHLDQGSLIDSFPFE